ncbi:MAG: radical SAM protein [Spirochaetaceae bacterium]|jgi:threonylcarbamoyladenosine tRNA methylthiotransferase MtaB|nr:radical SAM protein [Spirochaetaceae bacterium]
MTVSFYTLGCKLNQAESDGLAAAFAASGFSVVPGGGVLRIINTCTVTGKAEQKMRRMVRLERRDENAVVIVTGCAVKARDVRGGVVCLPGKDKPRLAGLPAWLRSAGVPADGDSLRSAILDWFAGLDAADSIAAAGAINPINPIDPIDPFVFEQGTAEYAASPRSRPFLKIQDGCGNACTYCAVTIARGPNVSLDKSVVLERLRSLEAAGFGEAVLTGVNICRYPDLAGLIGYVLDNTEWIRLRLSSLEPDAVDERLLRAVSDPRVRPHFHLSVQSGSDAVLARMGRHYDAAAVERVCAELRAAKDDPFLSCDIITGFPGETEADFIATYALCERTVFSWIHAFPFSPRPGTVAAAMKRQVPQREAAARADRLRVLSEAGKAAYEKRWEGRAVEAVVEQYDRDAETVSLVTENYLKKAVPREQIQGKKPGSPVTISC